LRGDRLGGRGVDQHRQPGQGIVGAIARQAAMALPP
jgi:hypothetical protein